MGSLKHLSKSCIRNISRNSFSISCESSCLLALNGGYYLACMLHCAELEIPDALPRPSRLWRSCQPQLTNLDEKRAAQQLTNLPSLMGIVTLAPISADLTCAGRSSGPACQPLSVPSLPTCTKPQSKTYLRHHADTKPLHLAPPPEQSCPAYRSCRLGHPIRSPHRLAPFFFFTKQRRRK